MRTSSASRFSLSLIATCLPLVLLACERSPGVLPTTIVSAVPPLVTAAKAATPSKASPARDVSLTIRWPSRTTRGTQTIPEDTNAITVRVAGRGTTQQKTILRTGTEATSQVAFSLFPGDYSVSVECLFRSAGQDRLLAQQLVDLTVSADQPVAMTIRPVLLPTPTPTPSPTPLPTPTPTLTPVPPPTSTPLPAPTQGPTATPTPTSEPTVSPGLFAKPSSAPTIPGLAPDDIGDPSITHKYNIYRYGELSSFIWIPKFEAVQIINPERCGAEYASLPQGYWVKTHPFTGDPTTDWATESFGGFYIAQFEASSIDSLPGLPDSGKGSTIGSSQIIKSQRHCRPMNTQWHIANDACRLLWPGHSFMMESHQFASVAIWSIINGTIPTGYGMGDSGEVTFSVDSYDGIALTGSGKNQRWTNNTNWTSHDFTDNGVFDLAGNIPEFVGDLFVTSDQNYNCKFTTGSSIETVESVKSGYIYGLSTDSVARKFLIPLGAGWPSKWDGTYTPDQIAMGRAFLNITSSITTRKRVARGGKMSNTGTGYFGIELTERGGARPILRF